MEAVVKLELLLEAEGLLIDEEPVLAPTLPPEERSRAVARWSRDPIQPRI
jgi:hypothetical protein